MAPPGTVAPAQGGNTGLKVKKAPVVRGNSLACATTDDSPYGRISATSPFWGRNTRRVKEPVAIRAPALPLCTQRLDDMWSPAYEMLT